MEYEVKKVDNNKTTEPSIVEMVEAAIKVLNKNPKGFFLMAEGKELLIISIPQQTTCLVQGSTYRTRQTKI